MERLHPAGQRQGRRLHRAHRCAARRRGGAQSPHGRPGRPHSRHQDWRQARARGAAATLQLLDEVPVGSDLYYQQKGTIFPTASFHSRPPPFQYLEIFPLERESASHARLPGGKHGRRPYTLRDFARTHAPRTCQGKLWWAHRLIRPHKHSLNLDLPPQNEAYSGHICTQSAVRPSQLEPSSSLAHIPSEILPAPTAHMLGQAMVGASPNLI
jgi:hypothetical protein